MSLCKFVRGVLLLAKFVFFFSKQLEYIAGYGIF